MARLDASYFLDVLYPLQDEVLRTASGIDTGFYLTGGTAASRGYLQHRFSDDLDLFVNDDARFRLWSERLLDALARESRWQVQVGLREERFVRLFVEQGDLSLKVDLVNDVPARVGDLRAHPVLGRLDSPENILANKITALVDRQEPKDLADIWGFTCKLGLPIAQALEGAQGKAAGIFAPDLARALLAATKEDWSLVRWQLQTDEGTFVADLRRQGESLLLPGKGGR